MFKKTKKILSNDTLKKNHSINGISIILSYPQLKHWIKVIKPSRASLTYERME